MDAPLEEGLTPFTGPDAVVVTGRVVVAHGAVVHVCFTHDGRAGVYSLRPVSRPLPHELITADDGAERKQGQLDIYSHRFSCDKPRTGTKRQPTGDDSDRR